MPVPPRRHKEREIKQSDEVVVLPTVSESIEVQSSSERNEKGREISLAPPSPSLKEAVEANQRPERTVNPRGERYVKGKWRYSGSQSLFGNGRRSVKEAVKCAFPTFRRGRSRSGLSGRTPCVVDSNHNTF